MKFGYSADWHFSSYSSDKLINGLPERLRSLVDTIIEILEYCIENKIKDFVVGGDLLHNKSVIHTSAVSILIDLIKTHSKINFTLISGNHDMSSRASDGVSGLKVLDSIPNVHVIYETERIENILFAPWNYVSKELFLKESSDHLISHFGLNEAQLSSGISIVSDIGLSDLKNFKKVYLGHYHKNQSVGNCTYVGSPIQLDWGEKNENKRFLVIDSKTGEEKSILTTKYKKYCEMNLTESNKKEVIEQANLLKTEGHHVKINKMDDVDISDLKDDFNIVDRVETDITNRGLTSSMSSSDRLDRYMEIKGISPEKRNLYRNAALNIIEKTTSEGK
jgi:DNA repair exonuclease SbcCD nuclease subunit